VGKYSYTVSRPVWENIPQGWYTLRFTDIQDGPTFSNQKTNAPEPTIKLVLVVEKGPSKGLSVSQLINPASWGPKSNAARWAEALAGCEPEDNIAFDFEDYLDTIVKAKVIVAPDSKGVDRNRVDIVMPLDDEDGDAPAPAAVAVQTAGPGAGRRRVARPQAGPRLAPGLEDRTLPLDALPDEGWEAMQPPPAEAGDDAEDAR
jgi:hypothetical protein